MPDIRSPLLASAPDVLVMVATEVVVLGLVLVPPVVVLVVGVTGLATGEEAGISVVPPDTEVESNSCDCACS
jgi:hypothetical protein